MGNNKVISFDMCTTDKSAYLNDPWVSTSLSLDIAKSFQTGNGIIRIDLSKIPASSMQRGWMI